MFSVKVLCKSENIPQDEERLVETLVETPIILVDADSMEQAESLAASHFRELEKELTYTNALDGIASWKYVCILNTFELVEELPKVPQFTEVYSRYLGVDSSLSDEEIVDIYFKSN